MNHQFTIGKIVNNMPGFSFAQISEADNSIKWAGEMQYLLNFAGHWENTLEDKKNFQETPIVLTGENLENNLKLKWQEKQTDKIQA